MAGVGTGGPGNVDNTTMNSYRKYDFTQRTFPSDLGSAGSYNNHWVVININVQNDTIAGPAGKGTAFPGMFTPLEGVMSNTDQLRYSGYQGQKPAYGQDYAQAMNYTVRPRFTTRIKESIALYMPNSEMTYSDAHQYENISLTKFAVGAAAGAGAFAVGGFAALAGGNAADIVNNYNAILDAGGKVIGNVSGTLLNRPINPRVELLFSNTFQRQFTFDFMFAPANEAESQALEQIIKTLRFHAAPEARGTGATGDIGAALSGAFAGASNGDFSSIGNAIDQFFWVPPSEFDITFYHNGKQNTKIPKINTCVLKQIDLSYAPEATYATFSNGYPVQTRMVLTFQEVEVTHKQRVAQGY